MNTDGFCRSSLTAFKSRLLEIKNIIERKFSDEIVTAFSHSIDIKYITPFNMLLGLYIKNKKDTNDSGLQINLTYHYINNDRILVLLGLDRECDEGGVLLDIYEYLDVIHPTEYLINDYPPEYMDVPHLFMIKIVNNEVQIDFEKYKSNVLSFFDQCLIEICKDLVEHYGLQEKE